MSFPMNRRSFLKGSVVASLLTLSERLLQGGQSISATVGDAKPFATRPGEPVFLLEGSTLEDLWCVRRKVNPLVKSPHNPVMVKDRDWEGSGPIIHGTVLYDPQDKLFKCWYQTFDNEAYRERRPFSYRICYAISEDGYMWQKPELQLIEWKGSKRNNFIRLGRDYVNAIDVHLAPAGSGVSQRFVALYLDKPGVCLAYSDNGTEWIEHKLNPIEPSHSDDHNVLVYDSRDHKWMIYHRPSVYAGIWKRRRSLIESPDLQTWSKQRTVLLPDEADPAEFMVMPVFQRGNLFFGLLDLYDRTRGSNEVELVFSADGRNWNRVPPRELFIPMGPAGDFDSGTLFVGSDPVIVQDEMLFYYAGYNGDHERLFPSLDAAIGVGSIPLDRFFGMTHSSGQQPGAILTRPLQLNGNTLQMNANVQGQMRVAILDWGGKELPGFGLSDCQPLKGDSLRHRVTWSGGQFLQQNQQPLRLKLHLEEATFYAFTVL